MAKICSSIEEIRENIDRLDRQIVTLLAERGNFVKQAARFKKTTDDVKAPARVEQVISKVRCLAEELGASPKVAEVVYRAMISAFINEELEHHSDFMKAAKMNAQEKVGIIAGNPKSADNTRTFLDGSTRSYATLRTAAVGFGTYNPGWRWSLHAGPIIGKDSENHIGYVISGRMMVQDPFGNKVEIKPGYAFELAPGSDAWVMGDEPCIALDFIPI